MPPPADPEHAARVVVEGIFMKLGDLILTHSPRAVMVVKDGIVIIFIIAKKRLTKKTGGKEHASSKRGKNSKS